MNFSFGNKPAAAPGGTSGGFSFGATPATTSSGLQSAFGLSNTTPAGGLSLGTPTTLAAGGGLSFGTPSASMAAPLGLGSLGGAAPSSGLTFGAATTSKPRVTFATTSAPTGLTFGTPNTAAASGLNFGTPNTAATPGLTFGTPNTAATSGLTFGTPNTAATSGLTFGTPNTTATSGLTFGTPNTGATAGLSLSLPKPTASAAPLSLSLGQATATPSTGLTLGGSNFGSTLGGASFGSTLGGSAGFSLGGATTTAGLTVGTSAPSTGFTLGGLANPIGGLPQANPTTTKTGLTGGLFGSSAISTASSNTLGGPLGISGSGSIFGATNQPISQSTGLGGVDPTSSSTSASNGGSSSKTNESKNNIKETPLPPEILKTVEDFKKYQKDQKVIQEEITRVSPKNMFKVQEEVACLRQLLSIVSNSLQRNAIIIEKLKAESAQELKNVEIGQRTKDTPPGLQYENTAPTEYFHHMVEDFILRMQMYRKQIEELENHIAALNEPSVLSPPELSVCLKKLHESFMALASQLHSVHEAVKIQKEYYLNYRRVAHGDNTNCFETHRKLSEKTGGRAPSVTKGPTPFSSMSNAAAVAMANALTRSQQPAPGGPPAFGLGTATGGSTVGLGVGTGLGTTGLGTGLGIGIGAGFGTGMSGFGGFGANPTSTQSTLFPGSLFGSSALASSNTSGFGSNTATVKPLGFNLTQSTPSFGTTPLSAPLASTAPFGFNTSQSAGFQLQNPPAGNSKRGKR